MRNNFEGNRRSFLKAASVAGVGAGLGGLAVATRRGLAEGLPAMPSPAPEAPADVTLRIGTALADIAPGLILSTTAYNGTVPGPVIRLKEGKQVSIDVYNDTDMEEFVHWHGQTIPAAVDGAMEERTPAVPARGFRRFTFVPGPSGTRWVHSHAMAMADLYRGTYSGQYAIVYIEPKNEPGTYDREVFLATHEFQPFFTHDEGFTCNHGLTAPPADNGWEVGYQKFTINGKQLGYGEPVKVKAGERVMFRILNASATENIQLALPGHQFEIVALDGNPVPTPKKVSVLSLGTAERIDAVVTMDKPGKWILGTPRDDDRGSGFGIVVEYAGSTGDAQWVAPPAEEWDYTIFGRDEDAPKPDETIEMVIGKINGGPTGFNHWTINGIEYGKSEPILINEGKRYRLVFKNTNDDDHPMHLHRHLFELTKVAGKRTAGILKDTVNVKGFSQVEVDFIANNPGLSLFHCHHQIHMDFGLMRLFKYV